MINDCVKFLDSDKIFNPQGKYLNHFWSKGIFLYSRLCVNGCLKKATGTSNLCERCRSKMRYYADIEKARNRGFISRETHSYDVKTRQEWLLRKGECVRIADEKRADRIRQAPERRLKSRYNAALHECLKRKKHKFQWLITLDEFRGFCVMPCTYCNGVFGQVKFGKGLDRIDHKKDYTRDNVLPCCRTCNRIRGDDITVKEARSMILHLLKLRKKGPDEAEGAD